MKTTQQPALRVGLAVFVVGSIVSTFFFSRPRRRGRETELAPEQQRELDTNLTTPANATFGLIWPVIYAGHAALAIHQALPSQRDNPRYQRAMPWWATTYALNALFGYFFASGNKASRVGASLTTIATLPPALALHRALGIGRATVGEPEGTLRKSVSLYAGWLTVATAVSATNLLIQAGWKASPTLSVRLADGVLLVAGEIGLRVARHLNDPTYLLPFVAGFGGIAAKQANRRPEVVLVAAVQAARMGSRFVTTRAQVKQAMVIPIHSPEVS